MKPQEEGMHIYNPYRLSKWFGSELMVQPGHDQSQVLGVANK